MIKHGEEDWWYINTLEGWKSSEEAKGRWQCDERSICDRTGEPKAGIPDELVWGAYLSEEEEGS